MGPIQALILIVVIGVCLYLAEHFIPMAEPIKVVLRVLVVLGCIIFLLNVFVFGSNDYFHVHQSPSHHSQKGKSACLQLS